MIFVKKDEGTVYDAPNHHGCYGLMKLTKDVTHRTLINYSFFQPNGGIHMDSADPVERVYCVIKGSITIKGSSGEEYVVNAGDMVYIGPGEEREMTVNNNEPAEVLVVVTII
jgi:quercetin dioxygenase-like cupin family protein